jgi:hypothetical protein
MSDSDSPTESSEVRIEPEPSTATAKAAETKFPKKWIVITTILAALWILLTVLAEDDSRRNSIVGASQRLSASIEGAQVHEHFLKNFTSNSNRAINDPVSRPGIGGVIENVFKSLWYAGEQTFNQGPISFLIFLSGLGLAVLIGTKMKGSDDGNPLLIWLLLVPFLAVGIMFALKLVIVWILGAFGAIIQLIGSFAIVIVSIEKVRSVFDLAKSGRVVAQGVGESVAVLKNKVP